MMETQKGIFRIIFSIFITAYLIISLSFVFFYNLNFIKKNGFHKWIFFGEFEPTSKGFFWPFFIVDTIRELQEIDPLPSVENYRKSPQLLIEMEGDNNIGVSKLSLGQYKKKSISNRISHLDYSLICSTLSCNHEFQWGKNINSISSNLLNSANGNNFVNALSSNWKGQNLFFASNIPENCDIDARDMFWSAMDFYWESIQDLNASIYGVDFLQEQLVLDINSDQLGESNSVLDLVSAGMLDYLVFTENLKSFLTSLENDRPNEIVVAKIRRVFDGCSFWVDIDGYPASLGENIGIRIDNVDVPMLTDFRPEVREKATQAKDYIIRRLSEGKEIVFKNVRAGQFYNIVADVYVDGSNLANELIGKGFAKKQAKDY